MGEARDLARTTFAGSPVPAGVDGAARRGTRRRSSCETDRAKLSALGCPRRRDKVSVPLRPSFPIAVALRVRSMLFETRPPLHSTLRGVVLKYNEPPEARKPVRNWRLYVFKGKEQVGEFSSSSRALSGPRADVNRICATNRTVPRTPSICLPRWTRSNREPF